MDRYENAVDQLKTGIKTYIDKKASEIPCDRTFTALVTRVNSNGTYEILLNNVKYNNIKTIGGTCYVNETVKVLVPQNNYNNMFILKAIEDIGNYKLFDYTNDKEIKLISNDVPDRYYYRTFNLDAQDQNKIDCWFYIDNEYYVDDTEEYLHTGNIKAKGSAFVDGKINLDKCGYFTSELKNIHFIQAPHRICGWLKRYKVNSTNYRDLTYVYFYGGGYNGYRIDNFEVGTVHYLGEYVTLSSSYSNAFPPYAAKPNYSTSHTNLWATYWGNANDGGGSGGSSGSFVKNNWGGWFTANFPIFGLDINDSSIITRYIHGTDEEALSVLPLAVNYKPVKYQEIFATSFLMNEKAKVKIDAECLIDYNEKNHDLYTNEKEQIHFTIGQDYGHGFFKVDERPLKKIKYEIEDILYNSYSEQLTNYVVTMGDASSTGDTFRDNNTNERIFVRFSILTKQPENPNATSNNYIEYKNITGYSDKAIVFNVNHSFVYAINSDGTYERFSNQDVHEIHQIVFRFNKNGSGGSSYQSYDGNDSNNFYVKNGTVFTLKNTFIKNYPIFLSSFSDNYIYDENGNYIGKFINDDTTSVFSNVLYTNDLNNIKYDGKLFQYNTDNNKDYHKLNQNFKVQYYLNDQLISSQPAGTFDYGENILRLMRTITSEYSGLQKLSIRLGLIDGEVDINPNDILVTISGTGLIDQTYFSGDIEIGEEFSAIVPINPIMVNYDEDINAVIVERPNMRGFTWGQLRTNRITWQIAKDEYVW